MDMTRDTINKIEEMMKNEVITDEFGRWWNTRNLYSTHPPAYPCIGVDTLSGFVDVVKDIVNKNGDVYVIVESPWEVSCRSKKEIPPYRVREYYAMAKYETHGHFPFGTFLTIEEFIINMQVYFQETETSKDILKLVGNVTDNLVKKFEDNGISQGVTVQKTLTHVQLTEVPRQIELVPWRTFRDAEQPSTKFIFRMRGQKEEAPLCALFDLAGDLWKIDAMAAIKKYLQNNLEGVLVIA